VRYVYQFEAKDIGRFYDFYLPDVNLIIEIDGSYFHSDPRLVKEENMNPMQKRNKRVDEYKDRWALMHGIPLIRFWEKDIRENPKMVMDELKKRLYLETEKKSLAEKKIKRHINKIK
jgi:very-short-patch-repair endonuclease